MKLNLEKLKQKAHELALTDQSYVSRRSTKQFVSETLLEIESISQFIYSLHDMEGLCSQPAEEWLLDHAGFILEQQADLREQLTKQWLHRLPRSRHSHTPRLLNVCQQYFTVTDGELSEQSLIAYFKDFQEISVLTTAELWVLPLFLRVALFHQLSEVVRHIRERREVCTFVEELLSKLKPLHSDPSALNIALEEAGQQMPMSGPLIVHLVSHLREWTDDASGIREWLMCNVDNDTESLDQIQTYEYQLQAAYQVRTGNVVSSMRKIERWNWEGIFEQISLIEQKLRQDPLGLYPRLDDTSRDVLRKRVEWFSRRLQVPESKVVEQAIELADTVHKSECDHCSSEQSEKGREEDPAFCEHAENMSRQGFIAYYLLEKEGLKQLHQSLKVCGSARRGPLFQREMQRTSKYFTRLLTSLIIALVIFAWWIKDGAAFTPLQWLFTGLALLIPASEWAVTIAHWLIECGRKPIPLLKLDYSQGIPDQAKTMVVIPVIWSSPQEVNELADHLELHYLANRDPNLYFSLLGDFKDGKEEKLPEDGQVVETAIRRIDELNAKYPRTDGSRFFLFQRQRVWNQAENVWMGWERKRGKLVEFVELLRGHKGTTYDVTASNIEKLPQFRYLITLDADTLLPPGSAQRMISTIDMPYNRPRLNEQGTRVTEGYGVLQPRVATSYKGALRSRLTALWAGAPGIDPYAFAVSDPYQDGVGIGIFTGKGIFDVDMFAQVLCDRIPDNRVLSHDLLEGGFLRAGLLSDVELIDEQPATFHAYQKRLHRWVRGDWQLLCWLFPIFRNRKGDKVAVDLSSMTRWQIVDNLRRSLLSPVLIVLLLLAVTVLPGSAPRWLVVVIATMFLPLLRHCLTISQLWNNPRSIITVTQQVLLTLMVLPFQSVVVVDAIIRTLYRLTISKRNLLEWVSSAEVERRHSGRKQFPVLGLTGGYILIVSTLVVSIYQPVAVNLWVGVSLVVLWSFTPIGVHWLNRAELLPEERLSELDQDELRTLAQQIWRFFEDCVVEEDHWLPPDNIQIDPNKGTAHRTSPTNIGLYLASVIAARDFGFIDTPGLITRLERTITTVERLEKWNGHLFNWIHTTNLETLQPRYVSTVDSGNFVCSLIAVKEGLLEWLDQEPGFWVDQGKHLATRIEKLIEETEFAPLFDYESRLFSLGYDASLHRKDPVVYDLMASEARQASFIAIAMGQVPVSHWNRLGRAMTKVGNNIGLVSWSGTMFEYLMPCLFMHTYRRTLLSNTYDAIMLRQREYAEQRGVPFGISESGYYAFDYQMNYQYRAFGVPGLGFQRGLADDLVIAPYATILTLPLAAGVGLDNLRKLESMGARGTYGFYEAVDFTQERLPNDERYKVIRSFMAHHQGMSFLALTNLLFANIMADRFHRDKRVTAVEMLLQERIPPRPKTIRHPAMDWSLPKKQLSDKSEMPTYEKTYPRGPESVPALGILSNGALATVVTDSGGGFIRYGETAITRWKGDLAHDAWGNFFYIRDVTKGKVWSPAYLPTRGTSEKQRVKFALDRVTFTREDDGIQTTMEICVSPEWNADVRRLTLANVGNESRIIEVTTYSEIVLTSPNVDDAHPAFSKLFVETSYDEDEECLLARRRPRHDEEAPIWAAHALIPEGPTLAPAEMETDRSEYIGRGHTLSDPQKIDTRLRGITGAVTDPVFIMRQRFAVEPGEQMQLFAVTCVGDSRDEVIETVRRFSSELMVERTFQFAWTRSQIELRHLHISGKEALEFHRMAGRVLYRGPLGEEQGKRIMDNRKGQSSLWQYGISGDIPMMLVRIANVAHMPFILKVLSGYEYLRRLGIRFDLVLLNDSEEGYHQVLQDALIRAAEDRVHYHEGSGPGRVSVLNSRTLPEEDLTLLLSVPHFTMRADGRSLQSQIRWPESVIGESVTSIADWPRTRSHTIPSLERQVAATSTGLGSDHGHGEGLGHGLKYFNSWGGFAADGRSYKLMYKSEYPLPAPWINVMANPEFGCLVSEQGTGYTWWSNSRECKLTPWSNDPVLDVPGEVVYLRNENTGDFWNMLPWGAAPEHHYEVTHAQGYTQFLHERHGISHETIIYVPPDDPIKIMAIKVRNNTEEVQQLSLTYYAEWVLGVRRDASAAFVVTHWDEETQTLQAHNTYQEHFRGATAFLGIVGGEAVVGPHAWTSDRDEFIGRAGQLDQPIGMLRNTLSGRTGTFSEPCGVVQVPLTIEAGAEQVVYVILGCDESSERAKQLATKYRRPAQCHEAFAHTQQYWDETIRQIEVSTPSAEMDILLNGWLLYQSLCCRMWARTGFYQAGGAYGYRDQLQDSLSLMHTRPELTREQILLHAAHQYIEGDVQHWWHEETGRGIRTLFSDDYLWLPYAIARYIEHTGDRTILEEKVPYLHSELMGPEEHERYEVTVVSDQQGTVYEHGVRAIERSLQRIGEHGLPLIGIGDWNDGMSRVGAEGRGESVWLAWFLSAILEEYQVFCRERGEEERANRYNETIEKLTSAANEHGWDGQWYRRAFMDSGQWLGSVRSKECNIDAIAQSWSVISGGAPPDRARQAMQSFDHELVDRNLSIVKLLDPPFDTTSPSPGYIQGYPPGIRENGGQYTHGVIWSIVAWTMLGRGDKAVELFSIMNPINHTKTANEVRRYRGEPYAMSADVYTAEPHVGRAGWTWYTGAAGWLYQAGIEWILGLRRQGNQLWIKPCIPDDWPGYSVRYRYGRTDYVIKVNKTQANHAQNLHSTFIKKDSSGNTYIELHDDGQLRNIEISI